MGRPIAEAPAPVSTRTLVSHHFDADPTATAQARRAVKDVAGRNRIVSFFRGGPRISGDRIGDAELFASEGVTNVVQLLTEERYPKPTAGEHQSAQQVTLEVGIITKPRARRGGLIVSIGDPRPDVVPQPQNPDDATEGGRGLHVMEEMADESGFEVNSSGKTVWGLFEANVPRRRAFRPVKRTITRIIQPLHNVKHAA